MKGSLVLILAVGVGLSIGVASAAPHSNGQWTVNAAIGDESFIHTFGVSPTDETNEFVRVQTHLKYVELLLRARPVAHLSPERQAARALYLDHLADYWQEGAFPHNDGHEDARRPTFISPDGNICAVGYLVEVSAGRDVAEAVNAEFKYAFIGEINTAAFHAWADASGFTMEELATIQPTYDGPGSTEVNKNHIDAPYGIATLALNAVNVYTIADRSSQAWIGLAAGGATALLGALNVDNRRVDYWQCDFNSCIVETNHARSALSYGNIGVGVANVVYSSYRLLRGRPAESTSSTKVSLTQVSSPAIPGDAIPAVQMSVRF